MGSFSLSHWLIVLVVVLVLFGAGRIPAAMGDLARGIRAFRTGMRDDHAAKSRSGQLVECAACRSARGLKRPLRAAAGSSVTH